MRIVVIISLIGFIGLLLSCKKDKTQQSLFSGDCVDTVYFETEILPIIQQNCNTSGCHDSGGASGGYVLTDHSLISSSALQVLSAVRHENGSTPMPLGGDKLPDSLIQKIACWVQQGKLIN